MSAFFESGIFKNKIALRGYVANPAEALSLFRNLEDVAPSSERPAWQKYDWNEICGLMWRWLAVEKPPLDDFALQTSLKNTVADALERDALPVPPDSQLMAAAKHLLDQYATSDITGPFRVKFGRGKSTRLGAVHKKT